MVKNVMLSCVVLMVLVCGGAFAKDKIASRKIEIDVNVEIVRPDPGVPQIQLALLLDTSGSMSGLINQAKAELWAVVNEFITVKRGGKTPHLSVSLYEYGKSALSPEDGYIRQIVPFTNDLDKISQELFALRTNGGEEYCGWVIKDAIKKLNWSKDDNDLKVIFIAGNEPFTQGPVDYKKSCKKANSKGIIVNTIHCGSYDQGISGSWKDGAMLTGGNFLSINQNQKTIEIAAPQDDQIIKLSIKLNETYIAYGAYGARYRMNQIAQDNNSASISNSNMASRAATKSSNYYRNDSWDVVDAIKNKKVKLEEMKDADLPKEMRGMSKDERKAYVDDYARKREKIQKEIQSLNQARNEYIAAERKKLVGEDKSLGSAMIKAVRQQAKTKKFTFGDEK